MSDDWARLTKTTFDYRRNDGNWKTIRQTYDPATGRPSFLSTASARRCFGAAVRYPAFVTGHPEPLIEACAGLLDDHDPETAIRKEAEEELGYHLRDVRRLYTPYMSPGSVTERLTFFTADYTPADRISDGGGAVDEGEDIEVLEITLDQALAQVRDGRIIDAKTIMLIQHLKLEMLEPR